MCRDCGCSLGPAAQRAPLAAAPAAQAMRTETIEVITAILGENDRVAAHNRAHFDERRVLALNLMSSPGAGKTSLLEATIRALDGRLRVAVVEGGALVNRLVCSACGDWQVEVIAGEEMLLTRVEIETAVAAAVH